MQRGSDHSLTDAQLIPNFEQFAVAAYPRLVVVGHVLCGARSTAERTACDALRRARRDWAELQLADDASHRALQEVLRRASRRWRHRSVRRQADAGSNEGDQLPDASLWNAVRQLPRRLRWIVVLHYVDEQSLAEVAAVVRVTPDSLTTQFSEAMQRLRQLLADAAPGGADSTPTTTETGGEYDHADEMDLGLAEPIEEQGHHDALDARLRAGGADVRAIRPDHQETADALHRLLVPGSRRRGWAIAAVAVATAVIAVPTIVWLGGDQGGDSAEPAPSLPDDSEDDPSAIGSASSSSSPPTTASTDENDDSSGDLVVVESPGDRDLVAQYDPASGYLFRTVGRDWDGNLGVCVAISRHLRRPAPEELTMPEVPTGCVPGSRRGVPLTARLGDDLIEITLSPHRREPWNLSTELSPYYRSCAPTRQELPLEPGALYELACRRMPQIRRFPPAAVETLVAELRDRDPVAAEPMPVDSEDLEGRSERVRSVDVFLVPAGSVAGNSDPCVLVTVPNVAGWREACAELDGRRTFGFAEGDQPYLVRSHDQRFEVIETSPQMGAATFGCGGTLADVLGASDTIGMWTAFGCDGMTGTGIRPATSLSHRPDQPWHDAGEVWIGRNQSLAVNAETGEASPDDMWGQIARIPDTDEAWACGELAPCRGVTVVPLSDSHSIWSPPIPRVDLVTAEVREVAQAATDPGSIGVRVFDEIVAADDDATGSSSGGVSVDAAIHRLRDHEYRYVNAQRWSDARGRLDHVVGIWTVRAAGSDDWEVAMAFDHHWDG